MVKAKSAEVLDLEFEDEVEESATVGAGFTRRRIWYFVNAHGLAGSDSLTGPDSAEFNQIVARMEEDLLEQGAQPNPKDQVNYGKPIPLVADNVSTIQPRSDGGGGVVSGGVAACDDCSGGIEGFESNGKTYTSQGLYISRQKKYGKGVCGKCLKKYK